MRVCESTCFILGVDCRVRHKITHPHACKKARLPQNTAPGGTNDTGEHEPNLQSYLSDQVIGLYKVAYTPQDTALGDKCFSRPKCYHRDVFSYIVL